MTDVACNEEEQHELTVQEVVAFETDDNDAEVRALAAALAPQMEELETLLASPSNLEENSIPKETDDDDMDTEWSRLHNSEQLLRQELEFAQDFGHLLRTPSKDNPDPPDPPQQQEAPLSKEEEEDPQDYVMLQTPPTTTTESNVDIAYTLGHHARRLGFQVEQRGGWYSYPLRLDTTTNAFAREYVIPIPFGELKTLLVGLVDSPNTTTLPHDSTLSSSPTQQPSLLNDNDDQDDTLLHKEELLPVRTITIQIRPDVLCGAVMDAVHHALDGLGGQVTKRQGGHLRGLVGATRVATSHHQVKYDDLPLKWTTTNQETTDTHESNSTWLDLPAFTVDVQLCTYKGSGGSCERILLIRTYPIPTPTTSGHENDLWMGIPRTTESDPMDFSSSVKLKEAAALVQRIESQGSSTPLLTKRKTTNGGSSFAEMLSPLKLFSPSQQVNTDNVTNQEEIISKELLDKIRPCPSVLNVTSNTTDNRGKGLTLPALSKEDWPIVQSSWRIVFEIWNQLESLDLAHACLATCRFGAFPALPTLDVHYCSQMRRLCREDMILSLVKSASELEQFARESEYSCASLVQTLKPMFGHYGMDPPALPQPVPLTAYPLDYTPPQVSCPPWGIKVMEALNLVAAQTSDANKNNDVTLSSFEASQEAVQMVMEAFSKQDDEEQGARLGRKNVQVMDRLAKMLAHKLASIHAIATCTNPKAIKAAHQFASRAELALIQQRRETVNPTTTSLQEVPLFWCSVLVGGTTTGTCYVTARHLLLVTHLIPLVGGQTCTLLNLTCLEMELYEPSRLMNSIVAAGISVHDKNAPDKVHSFRPSCGAQFFLKFVEIIQEAAMQHPHTQLAFSERGGLLYLYGDDCSPKMDSLQSNENNNMAPMSLMDRDEDDTNDGQEDNDGDDSEQPEELNKPPATTLSLMDQVEDQEEEEHDDLSNHAEKATPLDSLLDRDDEGDG